MLLAITITLVDLWFLTDSRQYSSIIPKGYFRPKRFNWTNKTITIQWRTHIFSQDTYKTDSISISTCPVKKCKFIPMTSHETADVMLFHSHDRPHIPPKRLPEQIYVFVSQESEANQKRYLRTPIIYNLTMTYRLDSDIPMPYGAFKKRTTPRKHPFGRNYDFAGGKSKKVAWVVSNCKTPSKRDRYVKDLKKYIDVDIYGKCGTLSCNKSTCFTMINSTYKFYLALENSICEDYITEKLYRTLHLGGIIPVVLGGADYSKLLPPHSVINVMDYSSPRALAEYLHKLDRNDTLYNEYFQWRNHYDSKGNEALCSLCAYLHNGTLLSKVYGYMSQWYSADTRCREFRWVTWRRVQTAAVNFVVQTDTCLDTVMSGQRWFFYLYFTGIRYIQVLTFGAHFISMG